MGKVVIFLLVVTILDIVIASQHGNKIIQKKRIWKKASNGKLYMINHKQLPWSDANSQCEIRSGKLLTVEDDHVQGIAKDIIKGENPDKYWIGLVEDLFKHWTWEGGIGKPKYLNWEPYQPTKDTISGCAVIGFHGYWRDSDCEVPRKSICQKDDDGIVEDEVTDDNEVMVDKEQNTKLNQAKKKSITATTARMGRLNKNTVKIIHTPRKGAVRAGTGVPKALTLNATQRSNNNNVASTVTKNTNKTIQHLLGRNTSALITANATNATNDKTNLTKLTNHSNALNQSQDTNGRNELLTLRHDVDITQIDGTDENKTLLKSNDNLLHDWLKDFRSYKLNNASEEGAAKKDYNPTISDETIRMMVTTQKHHLRESVSSNQEIKHNKKDQLCDTPSGYRYRNGPCDMNYEDYQNIPNNNQVHSATRDKQGNNHNNTPTGATTRTGNKKHWVTNFSEENNDIDQVLGAVLESEGVSEADQNLILGNAPTTKEVTPPMMQPPKVKLDETSSLNEAENQMLGVKNTRKNNPTERLLNPSVSTTRKFINETENDRPVKKQNITRNETKNNLEKDVFSVDLVSNKTEEKHNASNHTIDGSNSTISAVTQNNTSNTTPNKSSQPEDILVRNTTRLLTNAVNTFERTKDLNKTQTQNFTSTQEKNPPKLEYQPAHKKHKKTDLHLSSDIVKTYGGNGGGKPCTFPFQYDGETQENCIPSTQSELTWCSTTSSYDKMPLWGYCCEGDDPCEKPSPKPSPKLLTKFTDNKNKEPLINNKNNDIKSAEQKNTTVEHAQINKTKQHDEQESTLITSTENEEEQETFTTSITNGTVNQGKPNNETFNTPSQSELWKTETTARVVHAAGEEMITIHSGLKTYGGNANGARCVVPFVYDGHTHEKCVQRDDGTSSWCSATHNYDRTPLWGFCCTLDHCQTLY